MRTIAVANHKGGVGKTTTAINLSAFLAEKGRSVLAIDLDPQGHLGVGFGINIESPEKTTYNFMIQNADLSECKLEVSDNLDLIPSNLELAVAEVDLMTMFNRESRLKKRIDSLPYDYCIIDCPPSLGLLTVNGVVASDSVYIPIQMGYFPLHGVARIAETIQELDKEFGLNLKIMAFGTMYEKLTKVSREVIGEVRDLFKGNCFETVIRKNITLIESTAAGKPITEYDRNSLGYHDYLSLTEEVIRFEEENNTGRIQL
ncbi:MAG TPA: AAA family ATPase [Thermodesulfobacteriota bacterium]|nr:AAA family ATPase [Thermodesulfobacteriota bacterium]